MELNKALNQFLITCLSNTLEDDSVNPKKDFAVLGLDSISVFDFTAQLKEAIPEVPLTIFLECKNLKELETYLLTNHHEEIKTFLTH